MLFGTKKVGLNERPVFISSCLYKRTYCSWIFD